MPAFGKAVDLTPFSRIKTTEVLEAIAYGRASAIQAIMTLLMGDPYWLGAKRGTFRYAELVALATSPASMTVELTQGSALVNDGSLHNGRWYLIYGNGRSVTIPASTHPTLTRWDILCIAPKLTPDGSVEREVVDSNGNVSNFTAPHYQFDDFDLTVVMGNNGGAQPSTDRNNAHNLVPAGLIPVALIRVQGGATTITDADITDLREIFIPRGVPVAQQMVSKRISDKLYKILPPAILGQPTLLRDGGNEDHIPPCMFFEDRTGLTDDEDPVAPGVLKYKYADGTIKTIAMVEDL